MIKFYPECQSLKLFFLSLLFLPIVATAQLEVTDATTPPFDPINLVENVFLGDGVDVISVTFTGDPVAVGFFNGENSNIGIDRGIIMTSGTALNAIGPNTAGNTSFDNTGGSDPDLENLIDPFDNTQNAAVYEITFRPYGDTLRFDYVFGSEEYDEFVCLFNDVFGFLITGPGFPVPTNIALVPGTTTPISVDNVNNGGNGCPPTNVAYYVNNGGGATVEYDAFTTVLTAEAIVVPCMTYTIKIAIADVNDGVWDSGVFLAANTFGSNSLDVDLETFSPDSTMVEGCVGASLTFDLGLPTEMDFPLDYTIFGSAINGVDYVFVPDDITIPADSQSITIFFDPIEDGIDEGTDTVYLDIQINNCERDTFTIFIDDNELVEPIADDITICEGDTGVLTAIYPLPLPPSTTFNSNDTPIMINDFDLANPITSTINVFNVTPSIIEEGTIFSICVDITHTWLGDLDLYLITPGGQFLELSTDNGGSGDNYENACFTETAAVDITGLLGTDTPFTGDYLPESPWSDIYGGPSNGQYQLIIADDSNGFGGTLNGWSITFPPIYSVSYEWGPPDSLSCTNCATTEANPLSTTTYYVTATDTYGCFTVDSAVVNVINNIPAPNIMCDNSVFGEITFSWDPVPGASGYEVNVDGMGWVSSNGGTSHNITGLALGQMVTIEVQGTGGTCATASSSLSCTAQSCAFVSVLNFAFDPSCNGGADGSAEAVGINGTAPYTYTLGATSQVNGLFTGLSAGNYNILITDANGCGSNQMFTLGEPDALTLTPSHTDVLCNGDGNGTASVSVLGGTAGYTYQWSDPMGQTAATATGLSGDTYFLTVTDANSCTGTMSVEVLEPMPLTTTTTGNDLLCNGTSSGDVTTVVSGGTLPYTYLWSNSGETTDAISGLPGGTYDITITDANGCTITDGVTINEPTSLALTTNSTEASCNGGLDGTATVMAMNGTPGYTYAWDASANNQVTAIATGLAFGSYTVTVTDNNGCEETATVNVAEFAAITFTMTGSDLDCFGDSDGTAEASISAGSPPYTYLWDNNANNQTTALATGLGGGTFTVTITDATGCSVVDNATVNEPLELTISTSFVDVNCNGGNDGSAAVSVMGGTGPYTYAWDNGASDANAINLNAGTYTISVTDANGCLQIAQSIVSEPPALNISISETDALCNGANDGTATVVVGGGTTPYTFFWNNGQTDDTAIDLIANNYEITVTDANGCTITAGTTVNEPTALSFTTSATSASCNGGTDGSATIVPSGGSGPYTFDWDANAGNQSTSTAINLGLGSYDVSVTDANNCIISTTVNVIEEAAIDFTITGSSLFCFGDGNGTAFVVVNSGTPPYSYIWDNGETTDVISNLTAGTYTVTIIDGTGCSAVDFTDVNEPAELQVGLVSTDISCFGGTDGTATATPIGGSLPYTYFWSDGSTEAMAPSLSAGLASVTITDANNCAVSDQIMLNQPSALMTSGNVVLDVLCNGGNNGTAFMAVVGGTGPYTYEWDNGESDE
ncbi:MAG: choice-of-anchor L domain-containing protein, partial [Bacteroidota bacterium]